MHRTYNAGTGSGQQAYSGRCRRRVHITRRRVSADGTPIRCRKRLHTSRAGDQVRFSRGEAYLVYSHLNSNGVALPAFTRRPRETVWPRSCKIVPANALAVQASHWRVDSGLCRLAGLFSVCRSSGGYKDDILYFILHFAAGNVLETLSFPGRHGFWGPLSTPPGLSRWNQGLVTTRGDQRDLPSPFRHFRWGGGRGNVAFSRQTIFHRDRPGGDAPPNP